MRVVKVDKERCLKWVSSKHYSRRLGIFWEGFALVENGHVTGVVVFGQPSAPIQKHAFRDREFRLYELTRLVVQSKTPNAASFLVGNALKMLSQKPAAVVSYADSAWGHCGIIYQATNWTYTGATKSHDKLYIVKGVKTHPMTLRDKYGITNPSEWARQNNIKSVAPEPKHRYFFFLGSRRQKTSMRRKLAYPVVHKYPKANKTMYDAGANIVDPIKHLATSPVWLKPLKAKGKPMKVDVPATISVTKSRMLVGKAAKTSSRDATLEVRNFQTAHATVHVSAEQTRNIGNYESLKVKVEVFMPCYAEEVPETISTLSKRLPPKVDAVIDSWLESIQQSE